MVAVAVVARFEMRSTVSGFAIELGLRFALPKKKCKSVRRCHKSHCFSPR